MYDLKAAKEYAKAGLLWYDNHCDRHYHISKIVGWEPMAVDHGRFYLLVEE